MLQDLLRNIPTPAYVCDIAKLKKNLAIAARIKSESGCKILLANKAFALPAVFPLMRETLDGTTASGLFEARLGREEFGKEVHVYAPAYKDSEFDELIGFADHIYFNTPGQAKTFLPKVKAKGKKAGLRINPGYSNSTIGGDLYNPCAPCSRFGTLPEEFGEVPWDGIDILHAHVLCQSLHEGSVGLIETIADKFGDIVKRVKAVNFGGGHYFTDPKYDVDALISALKKFKKKFPNVGVILEPGGALVLDAGYLVTTVLDLHRNDKDIAILDTAASCHMPDVLIAGWRAPVIGADEPNVHARNYVLGSNMCMTGDVIGEYSFPNKLKVGDHVIFGDQMQYSFVQNSTFNGVPMADYYLLHEDGKTEKVSGFGYKDFRSRLGSPAGKSQ